MQQSSKTDYMKGCKAKFNTITKNFKFGRPINPHWWSNHDEVTNLLNDLFTQIETDLIKAGIWQRKRGTDTESYKFALMVIIGNLLKAHLSSPTTNIRYSRDKNVYAGKYQYEQLSYNTITNMIDALIRLDYCLSYLAIHNYEAAKTNKKLNKSRKKKLSFEATQSKIRSSSKLLELIKSHNVSHNLFTSNPLKQLVILRDKDKNFIKYDILYTDTPETLLMKEKLKAYNAFMSTQNINLYITDLEEVTIEAQLKDKAEDENHVYTGLDFSRKDLHRVFSDGSFTRGGRFYGAFYQGIPSEWRNRLRINGKKLVELDFSTMHATFLYAHANQPMPAGDLYLLPGYGEKFRDLIKRVFNTALNARNNRQPSNIKSSDLPHDKPYKVVITDIKNYHKEVQEHFLTNIGLDFQFYDSLIAEVLMEGITAVGQIPLLVIHDSFLVYEEDKDFLEHAMKKSFEGVLARNFNLTNKYEAIIKVKEKGSYYPKELEATSLTDSERDSLEKSLMSKYLLRESSY